MTFLSPNIDTIIFLKGGDFMERLNDHAEDPDIERAIEVMTWEGPGPTISGTFPEGRVTDERHPNTHPLAKVVLKRSMTQTNPVATLASHQDPASLDSLDLMRISAMEGGE